MFFRIVSCRQILVTSTGCVHSVHNVHTQVSLPFSLAQGRSTFRPAATGSGKKRPCWWEPAPCSCRPSKESPTFQMFPSLVGKYCETEILESNTKQLTARKEPLEASDHIIDRWCCYGDPVDIIISHSSICAWPEKSLQVSWLLALEFALTLP